MRPFHLFYTTIVIILAFTGSSRAQLNITTPDTTICPGSSIALNATIGTSSGNFITFTDDIYSSPINLGFPFTFYGNTYTQCVISSNGFISFNTSNAGSVSQWTINTAVPGNTNCRNAIMGPYTDIDPSAGGSIEYSTQGTAPNRRFVVTYCSVPHFNCSSLLYTFQIAIFEGTNEIEFHIANKASCNSGNGQYAIQGVQNAAGTQAVTVPGRNYPSNWSAVNSSHRFTPSGGTYTVTPISFQFYPTGNNAISWFLNNSTTPFATGTSVSVAPATNSYYVARANGCIGFTTDTVQINIAPPTPAPTVNSPVTICQGGASTPLTATGTNLKWYTVPVGGLGSTTAPTPSTSVIGNTTWYVSQTVGICESPRVPIVVTITPPPASPTVSNNGPVCQNGTVQLNASSISGATYSWSGPAGFSSTQQNPVINNVQSANAGTYTLSSSINGCPTAPVNTVVSLLPAPTVSVASSNSPVCDGNTLTFTASTIAGGASFSWTGPNGFTATTANPTINPASPANSGTYSVIVSANGCNSAPFNVPVTVNPLPAAPAVTNVSFCQNGPSQPLTATGQNLLWYTTPTGGTGSPTAPIPSTAVIGSTTWYVSQTVNNCEGVRAAITVTIAPPPAAPVVSNNGPICQGQSLQLTTTSVGTGITYSWTGPNGFSSSNQNPTINNAQPAASGTYTLSATISGCPAQTATTVAVVNALPVLSAVSSNSPICDGNPLNLTATVNQPAATISWTGPGGYSSSMLNPIINPASPASSGTYTVSATSNGCSSSPVNISVTVNPIPTAPTTTDLSYCQFDNAPALTAIGQNLLWYTVPVGGIGSATAPTPNTSLGGTTTWYVSQTVTNCESSRTPITVTVIPQSPQPTAITNYSYCQFDVPVTLSATGTNLLWYTSASGGIGSTTAPNPIADTPGVATWYVSQNSTTCESERLPITVLVYAKPPQPLVVSPLTYCQGANAPALTAIGQNLRWYNQPVGGTGLVNAPTPNTGLVGTQEYYVSQSINGCEGDRSLITVTIIPTPQVQLIASRYTVCAEDTLTILNQPANTATTTFTWNFGGAQVLSGTDAGPYVLTWNNAGSLTVSLTVADGACAASQTASFTVNPSIPTNFTMKKHGCIGEIISVQAAWGSLSSGTYDWVFGDAEFISGSPTGYNKIRWNTPGEKYVTLGISTNQCVAHPKTDTIIIHDNPTVLIEAQLPASICVGDTIQISASSPGYNSTFFWSPVPFFDNVNGDVNAARVLKAGYIQVAAVSEYGCKAADSVLVNAQPCCDVSFPTAFTPNGDGRNDVFRLITNGNHRMVSFRIVNRWGQTVYESLNQAEGWDGTFMSIPQPVGNYQYFLRYQCGDGSLMEKKGDITLIR